MRSIIIDCSHASGTDLDREIVVYAEVNYGFEPQPFDENDSLSWSEYWQWEADSALEWIDGVARNVGYTYYVDENCLFMDDDYAELSL